MSRNLRTASRASIWYVALAKPWYWFIWLMVTVSLFISALATVDSPDPHLADQTGQGHHWSWATVFLLALSGVSALFVFVVCRRLDRQAPPPSVLSAAIHQVHPQSPSASAPAPSSPTSSPPVPALIIPTVLGAKRVRRGQDRNDEGFVVNDRRIVNPDTL